MHLDPTTYKVSGMTCNGCVRSVTTALERAAPGLKFQVSLEQGAVTVEGAHDPHLVEQAVEDAGFDFGGVAAQAR